MNLEQPACRSPGVRFNVRMARLMAAPPLFSFQKRVNPNPPEQVPEREHPFHATTVSCRTVWSALIGFCSRYRTLSRRHEFGGRIVGSHPCPALEMGWATGAVVSHKTPPLHRQGSFRRPSWSPRTPAEPPSLFTARAAISLSTLVSFTVSTTTCLTFHHSSRPPEQTARPPNTVIVRVHRPHLFPQLGLRTSTPHHRRILPATTHLLQQPTFPAQPCRWTVRSVVCRQPPRSMRSATGFRSIPSLRLCSDKQRPCISLRRKPRSLPLHRPLHLPQSLP